MPVHDVPTVRNPDAPDRIPDSADRKPDAVAVIDLADDGSEIPVAVRHPDGQVLVLTVKAHRRSLSAIGPEPTVVKVMEDSGEVNVTWEVQSERDRPRGRS